MKIIYTLVEWAACFVELFVLYNIYKDVFGETSKKSKMGILFSIFGMVLVRVCNYIADFSYFTIMILVLFTSITAVGVYHRNFLLCFSISSFYILCLSYFDFLIFIFLSNLFDGYGTFIELITEKGPLRTLVILSIKILWILLYGIVRKKILLLSKKQHSMKALVAMTGIGYVSFVYLVNQTFQSFGDQTSKAWFGFIVVFTLVLFVLLLSYEIKKEKIELNMAELKHELLEEKYDLMSDVYSKNAKLYHDLNKHLNVLYQLLETENIESAKEYIEEISRPITKLAKTSWTGVDIIDVIINTELDKMNEIGIMADVNVEFPHGTNLLSNDMCTILSNLLDNAIEATQKLEYSEKILFTMRGINQLLVIKVENKCPDETLDFRHFPKTTKANKELHGWGLPSVEETVKKYNGKMKCMKEKGSFIVTVMLPFE
jgi:hypothetical protein